MADLISIVIPMRNAAAYVREAIASLLAQDVAELELVVVDDGSSDDSAAIVASFGDPRVRIVPGPRRGIAAALNAGLAEARGAYFCRCDADDWYPAERLRWQLERLRASPELGAVCGTFTMVSASGKRIADQVWTEHAEEISGELRRGIGRTHLCTFMVRMEHLRALGGFRDYFIGTEDADFQLRLGERTLVGYEPRLSYLYRLHGESITHTQPTAQRKFLERTMLEFQKQRLASGADDLMRGNPPPLPTEDSLAPASTQAQVQALLLGEAWRLHRAGRRGAALASGVRACLAHPSGLGAWRSFAALLLKRAS